MSEAFIALQRLLPQHALSRLIGKLAASEVSWIKRPFIHGFAKAYNVSLNDAARGSLDDYASFNDFFTRELRPDTRPLSPNPNDILCPADGMLSQCGPIVDGQLLQAKGRSYSPASLLGSSDPSFTGGSFVTVYLAPSNYHRVHAPLAGTLTHTTAIPGELFSVNAATEGGVESLFARNERLVCRFATDHGEVAVVLVGALIVASIATVWPGPTSPYARLEHNQHQQAFQRGAEIGQFLLGSTVIVCFQPGRAQLDELRAGQHVQMGQRLGTLT